MVVVYGNIKLIKLFLASILELNVNAKNIIYFCKWNRISSGAYIECRRLFTKARYE